MRIVLASLASLVAISCFTIAAQLHAQTTATAASQPKVENIDERATHQQETLIQVNGKGRKDLQVNAFCLSPKGNILAACGDGPGEIRVLSADGDFIRSWEVDIKPEAINTAGDTVLVGGSGKLFRYTLKGRELQSAESPHAAAIKENAKTFREQAIANLERMQGYGRGIKSQIPVYENFIKQLEGKKELSKQEEQVLKSIKSRLEQMKEQLAQQEAEGDEEEEKKPKFTEKQIQEQVDNMTSRKMRIASISSDGESVYIATYALQGYTFDVWKLNAELSAGKILVSELRGCCGQMDVQACASGIYVAENSRHRVAKFSSDGEQVTTWGKRDRTGVDGFTSCCNPMNVCFNRAGEVFTAESNTGRIKRYTADGEFVAYIGDVKLVPGCKNVSIAVSPDNDRVYMLDITRNHIVLMKRKPEEKGDVQTDATSTSTSGES